LLAGRDLQEGHDGNQERPLDSEFHPDNPVHPVKPRTAKGLDRINKMNMMEIRKDEFIPSILFIPSRQEKKKVWWV
jgi:hypothetical protein